MGQAGCGAGENLLLLLPLRPEPAEASGLLLLLRDGLWVPRLASAFQGPWLQLKGDSLRLPRTASQQLLLTGSAGRGLEAAAAEASSCRPCHHCPRQESRQRHPSWIVGPYRSEQWVASGSELTRKSGRIQSAVTVPMQNAAKASVPDGSGTRIRSIYRSRVSARGFGIRIPQAESAESAWRTGILSGTKPGLTRAESLQMQPLPPALRSMHAGEEPA